MAVKGLYMGEAAVLDRALATPDEGTLPRSSDGRARLLVWGSWTAGLVSSLTLVLLKRAELPDVRGLEVGACPHGSSGPLLELAVEPGQHPPGAPAAADLPRFARALA